jgi:hypothetical protein
VPFVTLSAQLGGWHVPNSQTELSQSVGERHPCPAMHLAQVPPQSTPVSVSFFTPSPQVGAAQAWLVHTPLSQSDQATQAPPVGHFEHDPPQSMSVSVPFFTSSVHDALWHTPGSPEQACVTQSLA